jgi:uncharacterized protein
MAEYMILDLRSIFLNEKADLTFDYMLDLKSFELSDEEFPFKKPIRVYGKVSQKTSILKLNLTAEFDFFTKCDRCLKEITEHYKITFENILVKTLAAEYSVDLLLVEDEKLDLDELTMSNIILNLPMKHLCDKNCMGLCSKCGKSLEFGDCGCNKKTVDPRLESLKSFFE